jgi:hypothetical protein
MNGIVLARKDPLNLKLCKFLAITILVFAFPSFILLLLLN